MREPCKYCMPVTDLQYATFYERMPVSDESPVYGGVCSIVYQKPHNSWGNEFSGEFCIQYANKSRVFNNEVDICERYPIKYCPMCGREL